MNIMAAQRTPATARRAGIAARAVEAAAIAGIAWIAGLLGWTLIAPESVVDAGPLAAPSAGTATARPAIERSILWRARPFAPSGAAQADNAAAPETTLNLKLAGVVAGVGTTQGSAIILTPDNRQQAFLEGDTIIAGVILDRVLADRILIRREGVQETLYLPGAVPGPASGGVTASAAAPRPAASADLTPTQLYDAIQFEPVMRDGRITGMRLSRAFDPAAVAAAGLAEGDVLVEFDGRALADIPDFIGAFEGLQTEQPVSLVVERSGARLPLTLSFGTEQ